ncbi:MAG: hypothetical protein A2Z34_05920 [Planctomycetes bacterium RBG_16_59_8]|nr:MAG: hypothetical protein A2Z34_05920 [Planctomycetes bacterium RBG_16_59_8]
MIMQKHHVAILPKIVLLTGALLFSSCKHWQHIPVVKEGQMELLILDENIGQEPFHCIEKRDVRVCLSMFTIRFGRSIDVVIFNKSSDDVHIPVQAVISEHDGQHAKVIKYGSQPLDTLSIGIPLSAGWDYKQNLVLRPNEAIRLYMHFQYPHDIPPSYESIVSLAIRFQDGTSEHFQFVFKYQIANSGVLETQYVTLSWACTGTGRW